MKTKYVRLAVSEGTYLTIAILLSFLQYGRLGSEFPFILSIRLFLILISFPIYAMFVFPFYSERWKVIDQYLESAPSFVNHPQFLESGVEYIPDAHKGESDYGIYIKIKPEGIDQSSNFFPMPEAPLRVIKSTQEKIKRLDHLVGFHFFFQIFNPAAIQRKRRTTSVGVLINQIVIGIFCLGICFTIDTEMDLLATVWILGLAWIILVSVMDFISPWDVVLSKEKRIFPKKRIILLYRGILLLGIILCIIIDVIQRETFFLSLNSDEFELFMLCLFLGFVILIKVGYFFGIERAENALSKLIIDLKIEIKNQWIKSGKCLGVSICRTENQVNPLKLYVFLDHDVKEVPLMNGKYSHIPVEILPLSIENLDKMEVLMTNSANYQKTAMFSQYFRP